MEIAARIGTMAENQEEAMYKELWLSLVNGSIREIRDDAITTINKNYLFSNLANLEHVELNNLTIIYQGNVFNECRALTSVHLPKLTGNLQSNTFFNCSSLISINLPLVSRVKGNSLYGCTKLETVVIPSATLIESIAFNADKKIKNVYANTITAYNLMRMSGFPFTNGTFNPDMTFHCANGEKLTYDGTQWNISPDDANVFSSRGGVLNA